MFVIKNIVLQTLEFYVNIYFGLDFSALKFSALASPIHWPIWTVFD